MEIQKEPTYAYNCKNTADGLSFLGNIIDNAVTTAFFDPQYRGVLDKLKYGNEGMARGKGRCTLTQMSEKTITKFIQEIDRVLKPSGHLFLWVDKFHLCEGVSDWFNATSLKTVDMITWDKGRMGMGYRTRRKSEYLLVYQKLPLRAKGCWLDHAIPDVWSEKIVKTHPHSKPTELQKRLICAVTKPGEIVLDPAAGGFSVLEACSALNIDFLGCDISVS